MRYLVKMTIDIEEVRGESSPKKPAPPQVVQAAPEPNPAQPWQGSLTDRAVLSVKDAAKALSIGRTSLFGLIKAGRLPVVKLGERTLIRGLPAGSWTQLPTFGIELHTFAPQLHTFRGQLHTFGDGFPSGIGSDPAPHRRTHSKHREGQSRPHSNGDPTASGAATWNTWMRPRAWGAWQGPSPSCRWPGRPSGPPARTRSSGERPTCWSCPPPCSMLRPRISSSP